MAAIVFSGKLTRTGWLPRAGALTRIVEALGGCDAATLVEVSLYGTCLLSARLIRLTALGRRTGLELARGGTFRVTGPIAALCSELTSVLADGLDSIAGDESAFVESTSAEFSELPVLSDPGATEVAAPALDFSSEGVASPGVFAPPESSELATGGGEVRGVDSSSGSATAGD